MGRGRPENPITATGPVGDFARHLRLLRQQSGLSLRQLAERTGLSTATLSQAQGGQELPTWRVARAFVQACGGNTGDWHERWQNASRFSEVPPAAQPRLPARRREEALASMSGPPPLPVTAETTDEFMECLVRVRIWAGAPSARTLARLAGIPPSTMQDFLRRKRLPTPEMLLKFLAACGIEDHNVIAEWLYAWRRLKFAETGRNSRRRGHLRLA